VEIDMGEYGRLTGQPYRLKTHALAALADFLGVEPGQPQIL
jgi:hypothetical protein